MKKNTRHLVLATLPLASLALLFGPTSCWPLAPSGGNRDAGSSDGSARHPREGGPSDDDASSENDGGDGSAVTTDGASDATLADAGDASDDANVTPPSRLPSAVATGVAFGCRIDSTTSTVWCWGDSTFAQAGRPNGDGDAGQTQIGLIDGGPLMATALALGDNHACAIRSDGSVYCWGRNDGNQLGHPSLGDGVCPFGSAIVPCMAHATAADSGVSAATRISAAGDQTCVVGPNAQVQCWGDAGSQSGSPGVAVNGIAELSLATDHACALVDAGASGSVLCWGNNNELQIVNSFCGPPCAPTTNGVASPTGVAAGSGFTCAAADGGVACFGDNTQGELGHPPGALLDQKLTNQYFNGNPTAVSGITSPLTALVASGNAQVACALGGGVVTCWGGGTGNAFSVSGLPAALSVLGVPDGPFVCGAVVDGSIWCWTVTASGAAASLQP